MPLFRREEHSRVVSCLLQEGCLGKSRDQWKNSALRLPSYPVLFTGTESETKAFMAVCIETAKRYSLDDYRTPVFIFERLCSIIYPVSSRHTCSHMQVLCISWNGIRLLKQGSFHCSRTDPKPCDARWGWFDASHVELYWYAVPFLDRDTTAETVHFSDADKTSLCSI